jgi:ribonuclease-3
MEDNRCKALQDLEKSINYHFADLKHLDQALTHSSYRHEAKTTEVNDNERLEFLGDSVLNFIISTHLYQNFPDVPEGKLAKLKSVLVSEPVLSSHARELKLGTFLLLGKGEYKSGGTLRVSNLENAFEALIGAIYLDGGIEPAIAFVMRYLQADLQALSQDNLVLDYKSILQEYVQARFNGIPNYYLVNESGPDHDKRFIVRVQINQEDYGTGEGKSKKEAEQKSARQACQKLKVSQNCI